MNKKLIAGTIILVTSFALVIGIWIYTRQLPVSFADPNLEKAIRQVLDMPVGHLTRAQVSQITHLDASGYNIRRLEGIEYLRNLRSLNLEDNFIEDVSPLGRLRRLQVLSLRNNEITSLEAINFGDLRRVPLRELSLRHNVLRPETGGQIRLSDIYLLSHFTKLEWLELRDNHIRDITPLANLTRLKMLDISQNPLDGGDISALSNLTRLQHLNLRETGLADLEPVANFPLLTYLNIHSNDQLESLEPIANLTRLETLIMANVPLGHQLTVLDNKYNLMRLNIRNTGTRDLSVLANLMSRGALQDTVDQKAILDIRNNPVPMGGYEILRPYWDNISMLDTDFCFDQLPPPGDLTGEIVINEVMTSNGQTIADEDGDFPDWIELYNPGLQPVNLGGYYLSDDLSNPTRWQFPQITIQPGQRLLVWASGKDRTSPYLHTNFHICRDGDPLLLIRPDGETVVDYLHPMPFPRDISYGRKTDGSNQWVYFVGPTPGQFNDKGDILPDPPLAPPEFSHSGGFYTQGFKHSLDKPDRGKIYYTLDGSEPTPDSYLYTGPIPITDISSQPDVLSVIRTAPDNPFTRWLPPDGPVAKATVVRARVIAGRKIGPVVTHTYFVGRQPSDLVVISLVTDSDNLFDPDTGIYVPGTNQNYLQHGRQWERPAHVEFFEPGGQLGFAQNIGIRIHGSWTRESPQKSLRLYAREEYGQDLFTYPVFPGHTTAAGAPLETFARLLLRNSGNDFYRTMFRDALLQSLVAHTAIDTQAYRPAIIYINGEYWGIQNIRERYDDWYIHTKYGIDLDDVVMLVENMDIAAGTQADVQDFLNLLDFAASHDLTAPENFDYIITQLDPDNFIDYMAAQIYFANVDWPRNNIRWWRKRTDFDPVAPYGLDGRWRCMLYDTDFGFGVTSGLGYSMSVAPDHNTLARATSSHRGHAALLLDRLLTNPGFRNQFLNRFADLLNTAFAPHRVEAEIEKFQHILAPEIEEHILRWRHPGSVDAWLGYIDDLKDFAYRRPGYQRQHIIDHFGLAGTVAITIQADPDRGRVELNSIAIDAATPGIDDPTHWTGIYFRGIPVQIRAIPAPGYHFAGWEGYGSQSDHLEITPGGDITLRPVFKPEE